MPSSAHAADKKRPRKQPPNQVWMDAIMSTSRSADPSPSSATGAPPPFKQMRMMNDAAAGMASQPQPQPPLLPVESMPPAAAASARMSRSSRSPSPAIAALVSVSDASVASAPFVDQLSVGDDALAAAVAKALKDLVADQDCSFVARGICHLCSDKEMKLVPVVNFCPEFSPSHSLCREHLRSMHRVRLVDIFAGKNQPTVSKRALRCTVCSLSCPCSKCQLKRDAEISKYKQWLTVQSTNDGVAPSRDDDAPMARTRSRHSTPLAWTPGDAAAHTERDRRREPMRRGSAPNGYMEPPPAHAEEKSRSSDRVTFYSEEKTVTSVGDGSYPVDVVAARYGEGLAASPRADEKIPSRGGRVPKRAAKESVPFPIDCSPTEYSSREPTPRGVVLRASKREMPPDLTSPTAASVLNCPDSEKSLVDLLSSLNQRVTPAVRYFADSDAPRFLEMMETDSAERRPVAEDGGAAKMEVDADGDHETNARRQKRKRETIQQGQPKDPPATESQNGGGLEHGGRSVSPAHAQPLSPTVHEDSTLTSYRRKAPPPLAASERKAKQTSPPAETANAPPSPSPRSRRGKASAVPPPEEKVPPRKRDTPAPLSSPASAMRRRKSDAVPVLVPPPAAERKTLRGAAHRGHARKSESRKHELDKRKRDVRASVSDDVDGEDVDGDDESELDANLDYCEVCLAAGDLVCCDVCPRSFHLKCLQMTEDDLPEGDWQCAECKKPSYFESFGAAVAEMTSVSAKCLQIVQCLKSHPFSKPFLLPVENVPHYTNIVKQPMDLSTIEKKLQESKYLGSGKSTVPGVHVTAKILHLGSFAEDVRRVWANCKLFNDDGSGITRAADHLSDGFEKLYQHVLAFAERSSSKVPNGPRQEGETTPADVTAATRDDDTKAPVGASEVETKSSASAASQPTPILAKQPEQKPHAAEQMSTASLSTSQEQQPSQSALASPLPSALATASTTTPSSVATTTHVPKTEQGTQASPSLVPPATENQGSPANPQPVAATPQPQPQTHPASPSPTTTAMSTPSPTKSTSTAKAVSVAESAPTKPPSLAKEAVTAEPKTMEPEKVPALAAPPPVKDAAHEASTPEAVV